MPEISVVIPVYNEAGNIAPLHDACVDVLMRSGRSFEIIWVNDGSVDTSRQELDGLPSSPDGKGLKIIHLSTHSGKSAAMQAGFDHIEGNIVVTLDGDRQNDPNDIPLLLNKLNEGYDVVCGWRHNRFDNWIRRFSSRVGNLFRKIFSGERIHDVGCMLRVYRAECLKDINLNGPYHRFLTWILSKEGWNMTEVEVNHKPRQAGQAKYNITNRLPESLPAVFALAFGNIDEITSKRDVFSIEEISVR